MSLSLTIMLGTYAALRLLDQHKLSRKKLLKNVNTPISNLAPASSSKAKNIELTQRLDAEGEKKLAWLTAGAVIIQPVVLPGWSFINAFLLSYSAYPYVKGFERSVVNRKITNDVLGGSWAIFAVANKQYLPAAIANVIYHVGSEFIENTRRDLSLIHI